MNKNVTTAARRVAKTYNAKLNGGLNNGFLLFHSDGTGGAWYSDKSRPSKCPGDFKIYMGWNRMTAATAQEMMTFVP